MSVIYVIEHHDQLLHLWREQDAKKLRIAHLDFHCDMRGLLINRRMQRAYQIDNGRNELDEGNFLTYAIMERRVQSVRWVHRVPGGRQYDVGTVKYETDLTGGLLYWLLFRKGQLGIPIDYDVIEFTDWYGLNQGEFLDIDWDFFACLDYPISTIDKPVETFFAMQLGNMPEQISVCYSPDFSHPSRPQFEAFVHRLAQMCRARIIRLPFSAGSEEVQSRYKKHIPKPFYHLARNSYYRANLWLRKRGIY